MLSVDVMSGAWGGRVQIPCENPFEARDDRSGFRFLASAYLCQQSPVPRWSVTGPKLNKDGSAHQGGVMGSRVMELAEVPVYVRVAVAEHYEQVAEDYLNYFKGLANLVWPREESK